MGLEYMPVPNHAKTCRFLLNLLVAKVVLVVEVECNSSQ